MFSSLVSRPRASPSSATDRPSGAAGSECYFGSSISALGIVSNRSTRIPAPPRRPYRRAPSVAVRPTAGGVGGLTSRLR